MRTVHIPWPVLVVLLAVTAVAGCDIKSIMPSKSGNSAANAAIDKLGEAACGLALAMNKSKVSQDPALTEPVDRVKMRLVDALKQSSQFGDAAKNIDWRINVIDDKTQENAFTCPGGQILVYSGVFKIAKDESGLAATLGHEMTHAIDRHTSPPLDAATLASAGAITASIAGATKASGLSPDAKRVVAALGLGSLVGISQGFSREQEKEADRGGILLMAQAGYDPNAYLDLLNRFMNPKCAKPNQLPELLSAHPDPAARYNEINNSGELMSQAKDLYGKSAKVAPGGNLPVQSCA